MIRQVFLTFLLIILLIINSCNYRNIRIEREIDKSIKKWQGEKIILPDSLEVLINDTLNYYLDTDLYKKENIKIVTLFSNTVCTKCIYLRLKAWIDYNENLKDIKPVEIMIIYCGANEYFRNIIFPDFNYSPPIILDTNCVFLEKNKIPEEEIFHTMLIDENSRIILIGDPTLSDYINRKYEDIIFNLKDN